MKTSKPLPKRIVRRGLDAIDKQPTTRKFLRRLSMSGAVHRSIWSRLSADSEFTVSLRDGDLKYAYEPGDQIANTLFWRGAYEEETSRVFAALAREAHLVLDVGANTGFYTLLACLANRESTVIAFEPVPHVFEILKRNTAANGWLDRCDLRCEAVAERCGQTQFHVPLSNIPTSASMHRNGFRGYEGHLIDSTVTTIDSICRDCDHVDLVKIDVEGFEHKVLEGMKETLEKYRPNLIVECNTDGPCQQIETILSRYGYSFSALRDCGPIPYEHLVPDPQERYRNFLCSTDLSILKRVRP